MTTTTPSRSTNAAPGGAGPTTPPEPLVSTLDASNLRHGSVFEKERERLISDISQGFETILANSNALNRKLEESISVGKEFEPIADLWGRFTEMMATAGIPNPYATQPAPTGTGQRGEAGETDPLASGSRAQDEQTDYGSRQQEERGRESRGHAEAGRRSDRLSAEERREVLATGAGEMKSLPPGVAPGGGIIYGLDS